MLIRVNKDLLLESLQTVSRAVPTRSVIPALSGILLEAHADGLRITGNDLEISITTQIACQVEVPGEALVPARLLTETIRRSPDEQVVLHALPEKNAVQIASGTMQMEVLTLSADEFPEVTSFTEEYGHIVPQWLVKNMIRQVIFAVSREELRPILTGALWSLEQDQLKMTALDGYRMASRWAALGKAGEELQVVVPGKALRELLRLLSDTDNELQIAIGSNSISFSFDGVNLISRLLEGQFPNTEQFMPKAFQTRVTLKAEQLNTAVERAALVSKEGADGSVKLSVDGNRLSVSAQSIDIGRHYEELEVEKTGDDLQIMFNIRALSELLRSAESAEVTLDLHGSYGPGILRPVGSSDYVSLLMPVRLN